MTRREFVASVGAVTAFVALGVPDAGSPTPPKEQAESYPLLKGDVFTIEGRYALNPTTLRPTTHLQQFIVTEVSDSGFTLNFFPSVEGKTRIKTARVRQSFTPPPHVTRQRRS